MTEGSPIAAGPVAGDGAASSRPRGGVALPISQIGGAPTDGVAGALSSNLSEPPNLGAAVSPKAAALFLGVEALTDNPLPVPEQPHCSWRYWGIKRWCQRPAEPGSIFCKVHG